MKTIFSISEQTIANFDYYRNVRGRKVLVRKLKVDSRSENLSRLAGTVAGVGTAGIAYDAFSKPNRVSKTAVGLGVGAGIAVGVGAYRLHQFLKRKSERSRS